MTFTSRVANVMVRKSIFIDISFLQKLNEKARLIPGLFFYAQARTCRVASYVPGRKCPEAPGVKPGKNKDCNMCIVCYNMFSDWGMCLCKIQKLNR